MEAQFKRSHLNMINETIFNLMDLRDAGILSKETVKEYIILLEEKYEMIKKELQIK